MNIFFWRSAHPLVSWGTRSPSPSILMPSAIVTWCSDPLTHSHPLPPTPNRVSSAMMLKRNKQIVAVALRLEKPDIRHSHCWGWVAAGHDVLLLSEQFIDEVVASRNTRTTVSVLTVQAEHLGIWQLCTCTCSTNTWSHCRNSHNLSKLQQPCN